MNRLWLFKALRKHRKLAEKRMVDFGKNKAAKWVMGFIEGLVIVYLIMFAVMFALIANDMRTMSSIEFLCCISPIMIIIDFSIRFMVQQTPSQIIKPYVLLPIPKYTCIDFFIAGQMLSWSNLTWFVMIIPFCLMSVIFSYGFWACVGLLVFFWLLELCISQFYLIVRTLITDSLVWWLLPIAVIIVALMPSVHIGELIAQVSAFDFSFSHVFDIEDFFRFYAKPGTGIETGQLWPYLMLVGILAVLTYVNRRLQYSHVMSELSRTEQITTVSQDSKISAISAKLSKFGTIGLFLGLEIKTNLRNKNPRKSLISGIAIILLFSLVIIFTDVYDDNYMANFWCLYDYTIFGAMSLIKIMCNEGNFIDGLMVRKENILQILKAKYLFNCLVLLLPFILMMPTVFSGKWSFFMVFSYGVFTVGFQYFLLFQLATTNKTTTPLNTKFISKNGMENNYWQIAIEMICMFVPVVFVSIIQAVAGNTWAYVIMTIIGLAFIFTSNIWLRNIYNRFMRKRYTIMEGYRATR